MVELARDGVAHYLQIGSTFQALQLAVAALTEAPDDVDLLAGCRSGRVADRRVRRGLVARHPAPRHHRPVVPSRRANPGSVWRPGSPTSASDLDRLWALTDELVRCGRRPAAERGTGPLDGHGRPDVHAQPPSRRCGRVGRALGRRGRPGRRQGRAGPGDGRAGHRRSPTSPNAVTRASSRSTDAVAEAERIEDWVLVARGLNNLANVAADDESVGATSSGCGRPAAGPASTTWPRATTSSAWPTRSPAKATLPASWRHLERASDYLQAKARDWELQLRITLCIEGDRLDEADELMATWVATDNRRPRRRLPRVSGGAPRGPSRRPRGRGRGIRRGADIPTLLEGVCRRRPDHDVRGCVAGRHSRGRCRRHGGPLPDPHHVPRPRRGARGCRRRRPGPARRRHPDCSRGASTRWAPSYRSPIGRRSTCTWPGPWPRTAGSPTHEVEATTARGMLERWPGWRRDSVDALLQRLDGAVAPSGDGDGALDPTRARGRGASRRGPEQRRRRPTPVHLPEDRRGPRLEHPDEARDVEPLRGRRLAREASGDGKPVRPLGTRPDRRWQWGSPLLLDR